MPQRVLFLCTHNSARSQMAQGLLNWLAPDRYIAFSAGTHPSTINPLAIRVMKELGIDIQQHGTHTLSEYIGQPFDTVITVCDSAAEECPVFPGAAQQLHWGYADPTAVRGDEAAQLAAFRHTRDLILVRLRQWTGQETTPDTFVPVPAATLAPPRILLLSPGNTARSVIAEAWFQYLGGTSFDAVSAGIFPGKIHPIAIEVMDERGIDIRGYRSKSVNEYLHHPFEYVITIYDPAEEDLPAFPGPAYRDVWTLPNPAAMEGRRLDQVRTFRAVRDALYFAVWSWLLHPPEV